jgi:two-component system, NtrC family, sensor kinase
MTFWEKIKPKFWDHLDAAAGPYPHLFNFRRIWIQAVALTASVALIPLFSLAIIDYQVTQKSIESEILLRTSRLASNTRRSISYFLEERKAALDFIAQDNTLETLSNPQRLQRLLSNLKKVGVGGFIDLGVIDAAGEQKTYIGPYPLEGKNYRDQGWFKEVLERGIYISDVFLGFRHVPHLVIAVKQDLPGGSFYILRATLDTERFNNLLSNLEISGLGDAFLINRKGILQTPSTSQGKILTRISLPVPAFSKKTEVLEISDPAGTPLIIGYAYLSDTPFILMVAKHKEQLMKSWYRTRTELLGFLALSSLLIILVILGVATYLVNRTFLADQRRVATLHKVEYSNKLASIGRLAAGVAHEINNPLAIINEKAGLIKDLFALKEEYTQNPRLMSLIDSIISSVERCSTITRRMLRFARHMEVGLEPIEVEGVIREVLGFLGKEAEYRSIDISVKVLDRVPPFESDRGKLQQIFLNIINNAFAALSDGGRLEVTIQKKDPDSVVIRIADTGRGIPEEDIKRIFEPFFTTKAQSGGTGLGLSVTYGLVQELGGQIFVQSKVGKGTSFFITLPLHPKKKGEHHAGTTG